MLFVALGVLAFLLYYAFDLNTVYIHSKAGRHFFLIGTLLLLLATIGLLVSNRGHLRFDGKEIFFWLLAFLFLLLLIYTLFFALPAEEAYSGEADQDTHVCMTGVYALCRHPGVLWLSGFYFFFALAMNTKTCTIAAAVFIALDIIYVILQDTLIFPKQFSDYKIYQKNVPFLLPTLRSIRLMIHTLH